ncbi:chloride channel protein [Nitrolancea hollandica]|uniref:Cl-channel, voltage gated n=1 Tax=Nitrolancea hollandica Lb TaxID=1129897 RepID=I4EEA8_9BACT|nr:chloride channel protein [Nitrolancea hollandica]CCF83020.1 Cl-channel, voltage gated [Nitrolancea hollandica Lb]
MTSRGAAPRPKRSGSLSERYGWDRTEAKSTALLSIAAVFLGIMGAVAAFFLYKMILLFTNLAFYQTLSVQLHYPPEGHIPIWMIGIPAIGGLIVGFMAYYGTDRIRGHGIPEAMEAILVRKSRVPARVAFFKPISAAIAVGTGGPFGAEGPIIQTGGAFSSLIGQLLPLTAAERKVFMACGAAAGMVGIFNTPIAAVALVLELLLFEFRPRSLIPVVIASGVAASARTVLIGPHLMFGVPPVDYGGVWALPLFVPLAVLLGLGAVLFSRGFFWVEELFEERLHLNMIVAPAIGGLILGIVAYFEPRVLGMGYDTITGLLEGRFAPLEAIQIGAAKTVALWFALGSGTSGGLLAPMLMVGAAIGSIYGHIVTPLVAGWLTLNPNVFAIVALCALFSAAARAPFTSFLFAFELTGDYNAIAPLMIGCMVADIVARLFMRYSIMTERLAQRGLELPTNMDINLLLHLRVKSLMKSGFRVALAETPVRELLGELQRSEALEGRRQHIWWIVEQPDGTLVGLITRRQVLAAKLDPDLLASPAWRLANTDVLVAQPEELVHDALTKMLQDDLPWLPVVDEQNKVVGYLTREDAMAAAQWVRMEDEAVRKGLIKTLPGMASSSPQPKSQPAPPERGQVITMTQVRIDGKDSYPPVTVELDGHDGLDHMSLDTRSDRPPGNQRPGS